MDIQLEKAIKALEFYALPGNWKDSLLAITTLKEIRGNK